MKILHVLASNKFSGAENVVCQIVKMFEGDVEMAYCSLDGPIAESLSEKNVNFFPIKKLCKKEVERVAKDFGADVVHAHDLRAGVVCSQLAKKHKIVLTVHGNKPVMRKVCAKSLLFLIACKKISNIFWVSKSCFEDFVFKKHVANKSAILPNIIDVSGVQKRGEEDKNCFASDVVFVGRLTSAQKNPIRIVEIAALLVKDMPDIKFCIVGDGEEKEPLQKVVENLKLEKNIKFVGFQNNPHPFVKNSKLMILTSVWEGTPMCAIEAMALGVPVISTKTDGLLDLIGSNKIGFLFDTNEQAAEIIKSFLKDEQAQKEMSNECLKFSKMYNNIEDYKKTLEKVYFAK